MCGIFGYVGPKDCKNIIQDGLEALEYRGYDSAGIAFRSDRQMLSIVKTLGSASKDNWIITTEEQFNIGIGHTRWSTHGKPTLANAHPHTSNDGKIAIVMNGIIENYEELKLTLDYTYTFKSTTDTEVLAHLIQREYKQQGFLRAAVTAACRNVKGNFAVAVIHADESNIVCYSNGAPLHIGQVSNEECYISSDINSLRDVSRYIGSLKDRQVAVISKTGIEVRNKHGLKVYEFLKYIAPTTKVSNDMSLNGYETHMMKEINEQSKIIKNVLHTGLGNSSSLFDNHFDNVVIIGCGSSYNAGLTAKYLFNTLNIPAEVYCASEYKYYPAPIKENSLFIFLTQSGETADTLSCAATIKSRRTSDIKMIAITNTIYSSITNFVDRVEYLQAGPEISVAATKSFTSMLTVLYQIALRMCDVEELRQEFEQVPNWYTHFTQYNSIDYLVSKIMCENNIKHFIFLGKGYNYPIALEGALKLKEISYMPACGYPSGEMKHGPIALLDESVAVIVLNNSGRFQSKTISSLKEAETRGAKIINVSDTFVGAHYNITVPTFSEELTPFINVLVLQLFAYYVAKERRLNIDRPRNLAKSVTVE